MTQTEELRPQPAEALRAPVPNDADAAAASPQIYQEINARRARVENAELLHHLRGL